MADLKTTAEERARLRCDDMFARVVVDDWTGRTSNYDQNDEVRAALDDVDTLLAENAKLRAVAEAAKFVCSRRRGSMLPQAIDDLDEALAALEAP